MDQPISADRNQTGRGLPDRQHSPWSRHWPGRLASLLLIALIIVLRQAAPVLASLENTIDAPASQQTAPSAATAPSARLAAGYQHSALIHYDRQLYLWGDNTYGQLGLADSDYQDTPTLLSLPQPVTAVSLGAYHSLAVTEDGNVYAFGRNSFGQLGLGHANSQASPIRVTGLPAIQAVSAGAYHSLALAADGSVWAWGNNTQGQVGAVASDVIKGPDGTVLGQRCTKPVQVVDSGAVMIAAGGNFSLILTTHGQVLAWGDNSKGQLGDGTVQAHAAPARILDLKDVTMIAAGYEHALAMTERDGVRELYAWGDHSLGQLGLGINNQAGTFRVQPERVDLTGDDQPANDNLLAICAGYAQSAAIVASPPSRTLKALVLGGAIASANRQKLYVWGSNSRGQLAIGSLTSQARPTLIQGRLEGSAGSSYLPFDALVLGGEHLLVLSSKGLAAAAGRGDRGQLGTGSIIDCSHLTSVTIPDLIRPRWTVQQQITFRWRQDNTQLEISWPAAQDNQSVAGYRLAIRRAGEQVTLYDPGQSLVYTLDNQDPAVPLEAMVYAYDQASASAADSPAGLSSLGHLTAYLTAENDEPGNYFLLTDAVTDPREAFVHLWTPDPSGHRQALEVPWSLADIPGIEAIPTVSLWFWLIPGCCAVILGFAAYRLSRRHSAGKQNQRSREIPLQSNK